MRESPYFITANETEKSNFNSTIERYSDKYSRKKKLGVEWQTGYFLTFNFGQYTDIIQYTGIMFSLMKTGRDCQAN